LLLQPHLIQTGKSRQFSSENVSVQAAIRTPRTSQQHHKVVLPEILSFVQMETELLPIMEPKGSKHPTTSSSQKPHSSNPKHQMSSTYPAFKPVTKYNLRTPSIHLTHWNTLSSLTRPGSPSRFNTRSSARRLRHRCRLLVILAVCQ